MKTRLRPRAYCLVLTTYFDVLPREISSEAFGLLTLFESVYTQVLDHEASLLSPSAHSGDPHHVLCLASLSGYDRQKYRDSCYPCDPCDHCLCRCRYSHHDYVDLLDSSI